MSIKKYKFISPGVFVSEIDKSQLPAEPPDIGPLVIGRTRFGPGLRPVKVNSTLDFVNTFGAPVSGLDAEDLWRDGSQLAAPTYASYAALAFLNSGTGPVTMVRLLGRENDNKVTNGEAGYKIGTTPTSSTTGGAYGLFVFDGLGVEPSPGPAATLVDAIDTTGVAENDAFSITVPVDAGGEAGPVTHSIILVADANAVNALSNVLNWGIAVSVATTDALTATAIVNAINGTVNSAVGYATNAVGSVLAAGTLGLTAAIGSSNTQITLTMDDGGVGGNVASVLAANTGYEGGLLLESTFTGGRSSDGTGKNLSGTLAAVWYCNDGGIVLRGKPRSGLDSDTEMSGNYALLKNSGPSYEFKADIYDGSTKQKTVTFNFNRDSDRFVRKAFNTNPTLLSSDRNSNPLNYFLGESFEGNLEHGGGIASGGGYRLTGSAAAANTVCGAIVVLEGTAGLHTNRNISTQEAATGWFISQDIRGSGSTGDLATFDPGSTTHAKKLFRLHGLNGGEWVHNNLKVSIDKIKSSQNNFNPYGTFNVLVRKLDDNDINIRIVERYNGCDLNPASPNYIARRIGDMKLQWKESERRYVEHGNWPNQSRFMRVEVDPDLDTNLLEPAYLPFGVYGPTRYKKFSVTSGSTALASAVEPEQDGSTFGAAMWKTGANYFGAHTGSYAGKLWVGQTSGDFSGSVEFPAISLRKRSDYNSPGDQTDAYWGADTCASGSSRFDASVRDVVYPLGGGQHSTTVGSNTEYSWVFTLDDIKYDPNGTVWLYQSGSRRAGTSYSAVSGSTSGSASSVQPTTGQGYLLAQGIDKFTTVFQAGFDGVNITEKEPFNHAVLGAAGSNEYNNYAYNTIKMAIDMSADSETLEYNVATIPGVRAAGLTDHLVSVCEDRGDALAIIDLDGDYTPDTENTNAEQDRIGDVDVTIRRLKDRSLNSSYGCAYYPWVQISDSFNGNIARWVPPSVVALGVLGSSEAASQVWFAPAGFNRGGLTEGAAGLGVMNVRQKLNSKERDKLYEANINPIASFPSEGIVIFGQKTLQVTQSALDRINVRRLMIFIKKEVSRIANRLLFDQNVESTWNRFTGEVNPFLEGIKSGLGLTDFKVILDKTTTTDELIDRNIMYAKVFLKPARAIEFIAIDFTITSTGASFED